MPSSIQKYYATVPEPKGDLESLRQSVLALKQTIEVLTNQRKPLLAAAVTFQDLKDLGITDVNGRSLQDIGTLLNWLQDVKPILESEWTAFTSTVSSTIGTITTASCAGRYKQVGKTVFVFLPIVITTNGTGAGNVRATLPFTASQHASFAVVRTDIGVGCGSVVQSGTNLALIARYDGVYPGASGATFVLSGVFEIE